MYVNYADSTMWAVDSVCTLLLPTYLPTIVLKITRAESGLVNKLVRGSVIPAFWELSSLFYGSARWELGTHSWNEPRLPRSSCRNLVIIYASGTAKLDGYTSGTSHECLPMLCRICIYRMLLLLFVLFNVWELKLLSCESSAYRCYMHAWNETDM